MQASCKCGTVSHHPENLEIILPWLVVMSSRRRVRKVFFENPGRSGRIPEHVGHNQPEPSNRTHQHVRYRFTRGFRKLSRIEWWKIWFANTACLSCVNKETSSWHHKVVIAPFSVECLNPSWDLINGTVFQCLRPPERTEHVVEVVGIYCRCCCRCCCCRFFWWSSLSFVFAKSPPAWNANVKQFHGNQQTMTLGTNVKNGTEFTIPKRRPLRVAKIGGHIKLYSL